MICLKNRTFAVSQTTHFCKLFSFCLLWFAWKIVLLQYRKQQRLVKRLADFGCDLLEKSYFCSIANNRAIRHGARSLVVICLKNRTFAVSQTTVITRQTSQATLWFAWKIVLLQYRKQHTLAYSTLIAVVICLKNRTFAVSQTTMDLYTSFQRALWFAWKIVLLQYRKQLSVSKHKRTVGCDLLEKSYFCSIANNHHYWERRTEVVVICLKNRTFAVSQTTLRCTAIFWILLWFAWKIVLLQYRKQRVTGVGRIAAGCDLLEKSYFCSIANNMLCGYQKRSMVVICLKNRTFAVSQTTTRCLTALSSALWFAWKIVLLQYRKQLTSSTRASTSCCDLLEKSYFCSIANN